MPTKQELETEAAVKDAAAKDAAAKESEAKLKAATDEKVKADAEVRAEEAKRTEGLIKMKRGDSVIHAHPTTIKDHEKNGWKVA